jgi:uncharacterized membrane protein YbhN (UPF0104 family)
VTKQTLFNICKYLLAFGLLAFVIWHNWDPAERTLPSGQTYKPAGLSQVWQKHFVEGQPIHYQFLVLAGVVFVFGFLVTLVRWWLLVRALDLPFKLYNAFRLGLIGFFFNNLLPGSVGGDVVKAAAIAREQNRRTVAVATVIMDRILALWGLVWFVAILGGACWLLGWLEGESASQAQGIVTIAAITLAVSVVVWLLMGLLSGERAERFAGRLERLGRVGGTAAEFWRAVWMYRCRQTSVAWALVLTWVAQVGFVTAFWSGSQVFWDGAPDNPVPTLAQNFLIVPIVLVIQAVPGFPGGAGIGELGCGALYAVFNCPQANGVLASLVVRLISWVVGVFGYLVYLRMAAAPVPDRPAAKPALPAAGDWSPPPAQPQTVALP